MSGGTDATQLLDAGSWSGCAAWMGVVLVGLAILMTLLDWGDLSGAVPQPPPRRPWALTCAVVGVGLMVLAGLDASVLA